MIIAAWAVAGASLAWIRALHAGREAHPEVDLGQAGRSGARCCRAGQCRIDLLSHVLLLDRRRVRPVAPRYTSGWPRYQSGSIARILTRDGARIGTPTGIVASTP